MVAGLAALLGDSLEQRQVVVVVLLLTVLLYGPLRQRLAEELQESRERLVTARKEERRKIRRDLHDRLGPALSGVVFQLESARLQMDRDPEAAKRQVAATSRHVRDVVADVRRLVHALRPPALDDLGLIGPDDGIGIREDAQAGVGMIGLRERAAELGGTTEVACPAGGGTVVRVRLPLRRSA